MGTLSEKSRRVLRAIYSGLGAVAVSFSFPACNWTVSAPDEYGMPPDYREDILIQGLVKSKKTGEPIMGRSISIWIEGITTNYVNVIRYDGEFFIYVPKQDAYTIVFTDIDGNKNGLFKRHTINLTVEQCEALRETPLIIELEEEDAE